MIFPGLAKGSYYKSTSSKTDFNLSSYIVSILVDQNIIEQDDVNGCCFNSRSVFIHKGLVGKGTILLKKQILRIFQYLGLTVSFECCNDSIKIFDTILDYKNIPGSLSLKTEIIRILDHFEISHGDVCCGIPNGISVPMQTFLNTDTPSYPVGVFNVDGDYVGIANNQSEYITLWNSDIDNQIEGTLEAGSDEFTFKLPTTATISAVIGLRFYIWTGFNNTQIFVGDNDIVRYGASTQKKGNIDGISISTDSRREWNRNLFTAVYKTKITTDTVRTLTCTGYVTGQPLRVFHNEDSEYAAVSFSFGYTQISGNLPKGLKAFFTIGQFATIYNNVTNWGELSSLYSWYSLSSGGVPWGFTPSSFPTNLVKSQLTQLGVGESDGTLQLEFNYISNTNFPNIKELVIISNADDLLESGVEAWFLAMPKINQYFRYNTQSAVQVTSTIADGIWNNIATALNGIIPTGTVKEIRIKNTANVTATSLTARNYLIGQGWTILMT